jgi:hypothetical protein
MSLQVPRYSTIGGGIETVHVIPLEEEIDRAVRAFEVEGGFRANKVYLLAFTAPRAQLDEVDEISYYWRKVAQRFRALGVETVTVFTDIFNILDVISKVSRIVKQEKAKGNVVYVNMSAGGPFASAGTAIAAMVQGARLYYVRCNRYVHTRQEKLSHGKAIVTTPQVHFLENFDLMLPDERGMKLLVKLQQTGDMRTSAVLEYLHGEGVEGFKDDPATLSRGDKIGMLMRLNKGITAKLLNAGYIAKEKRGRENIYNITESGKYVACVSGLIEIDKASPRFEP